jgi:predicted TIM-barrel fold metal-dependent hydrolase
MSTVTQAAEPGGTETAKSILISADSHVMEPPDLWVTRVPRPLRDQALQFPPHRVGEGLQAHAGGRDPNERLKEAAQDGVGAELLYPTLGLRLFGIDDPSLQEACCRVFNDWLIDYCQVAPDRLVGVAAIPVYNIDTAVQELERCRNAGLRGAQIWQSPHPDLPFHSDHYNPFWAAAQDLEMPVSLHILTGHDYSKHLGEETSSLEAHRGHVNLKLSSIVNALFDIIFSGVLERFPRLKLVLVENEIGWIPWVLQQWDYYVNRFKKEKPLHLSMRPSDYFARQVFATFFNDAVGGRQLAWWGQDNLMWSNDFPHPNSTWPRSHEVIARDLGHLTPEAREKVTRTTVARLYNLSLPQSI